MWKESGVLQRMGKSRNNKLMRLTRSNNIRDKRKKKRFASHMSNNKP